MIERPLDLHRPRLLEIVQRLGWATRRKIPFVKQLEVADCAAACLAMVLRHHGSHVELRELADAMGVSTRGTTADTVVRVAGDFGLRGRGLSLDVDSLKYLPRGSMLHWGFRHFLVLERVHPRFIDVLDPASGPRRIPMEQVRRSFTGVALAFSPDDSFVPAPPGRSHLRNYFRQLLGQRGVIARIFTLSITLRLFALAAPLLTASVVDRVVPRSDQHLLFVITLGLLSLVVFQFVASLVRAHLLLQLRTNLDTKLSIGFLDHLVSLPYAYFQRRTAGDLMQRLGSNGVIRQTLASTTMSTALDGVFAVLYLGLIFSVHVELAVITLGLGIAQTLVFVAGRHKITQLVRESLEVGARSSNELVQLLAGIQTLKLAGAEHRAVDRWVHMFVDGLNIGLRRGRLNAVLAGTTGLLRAAAPLCILAIGALAVMDGELSLGTMLAASALSAGFLGPLAALVSVAFSIQELAGHIERIDDVLEQEPEQDARKSRPLQLTGRVCVESVSFQYRDDGPMVLSDVSLDVHPGETIALVGKSGSGKSTLANLLLGIYSPTSGRILYDGTDLGDLDHRAVRTTIGVVPQHPFIFGQTVRQNIALQDDAAPLEDIVAAAKLACIDDDIVRMPMGYETVVADGGASLSGGQRQRLAIARALVTGPPLVIFDESTSSVDNATEKQIIDNLRRLECARVVIAHRLSTVAGADKIVVLAHGKVVEVGTHRELMASRGVYHELVAAQQGLPQSEAIRNEA